MDQEEDEEEEDDEEQLEQDRGEEEDQDEEEVHDIEQQIVNITSKDGDAEQNNDAILVINNQNQME